MTKNENKKKIWLSVLFGTAAMLTVVFAAAAIGAALISKGKMGEDAEMQIAYISAYISAVLGALVAKKLYGGKKPFQISMLSSGVFAFLRLIVSAMSLEDGLLSGSDLTVVACILCGGVTSAILGARRRKKRRS